MKRLFSLALIALLPLAAMAKNNLARYSGVYKGETRAQDETREQSQEGVFATRHHTMELSLGEDGTATLTQCPDAIHEITSFAHWSHEGDQIKLTFDPVDRQPTPPPMSFHLQHGTLTAVLWNHDLWRTLPPPPMHHVKVRSTDQDL